MNAGWVYHIKRDEMLRFVREAGARYWPRGTFPQDRCSANGEIDLRTMGKSWRQVSLPSKYASLGVNSSILVDEACVDGNGDFDSCDWYLAAFSHLAAVAEWHHECASGPAHSYSLRLSSVPASVFDYAWANRIMLLMRAMDADALGQDADALFGPLPKPRFHITHDVDALDKTIPIRIKQGGFEIFNILRALVTGKIVLAIKHIRQASAVMFGGANYFHLNTVADLLVEKGARSTFHLYARSKKRSLGLWLMDPGYAIDDSRLVEFVARRKAQGFSFGLHPSFDDWKDSEALKGASAMFATAFGVGPACIRQHWLRFSLRDTWKSQSDVGFPMDYTFGFNDRTGFRAAAALVYNPWDFVGGKAHAIKICPTIAMDSHFYAYQSLAPAQRKKAMADLLSEVRLVHGEAAVLWHPHTLADDYGWRSGFEELLDLIGSES